MPNPPAERTADEECGARRYHLHSDGKSINSLIAVTPHAAVTCVQRVAALHRRVLIGAYQENLGDLHNLYSDTHAVHVSLDADNGVVLDAVIKGDTVKEVLDRVECDAGILLGKLRTDVETAICERRIDDEEAGKFIRLYEDGLNGDTYLE